MHMVIRALVFAQNKKEALAKAREIFEGLCNDKGFDYFVTFNENSTMAGKNRWGKLPVVAKADSPEGRKLIEEGMEATKQEFMENMSKIRKALDGMSDEEIFEGQGSVAQQFVADEEKLDYDPGFVHHRMFKVGQYTGPSVWLYGNNGEGIRDPRHLESALNKWKEIYEDKSAENPYKDLEVWVVPADVHY